MSPLNELLDSIEEFNSNDEISMVRRIIKSKDISQKDLSFATNTVDRIIDVSKDQTEIKKLQSLRKTIYSKKAYSINTALTKIFNAVLCVQEPYHLWTK